MSRPNLGKRSSFSNFSTGSTPPGHYPYQQSHASQVGAMSTMGSMSSMGSLNSMASPSMGGHMRSMGPAMSGQSPDMMYAQQKMVPAAGSFSGPVQPMYNSNHHYLPRRSTYYESHWPLYACDWTDPGYIAVATYSEDSNNRIQVVQTDGSNPPNFVNPCEAVLPYPASKIAWEPRDHNLSLISVEDCLRLWSFDNVSNTLTQRCALVNKSKSDYMPPMTSFDWNKVNPSLVITSSIDTTCTVWDLHSKCPRTQLIAHDKDVYDVAWISGSVDVFTSISADGSVRIFDLRSLDHSTIIYEPPSAPPLLRVAPNPDDPNVLATIAANSSVVQILDIRVPGIPTATLEGHSRAINAIKWHPKSRNIIASGADDCQVILWSVNGKQNSMVSSYCDSGEVNNLSWNCNGEWLGVVSGRGVQGVKV